MRVKEKNKHVKTTSNFDVLVINAIRIIQTDLLYLFLLFKSVFTFTPYFHLEIGLSFGLEHGIMGKMKCRISVL